MKIQNIHPELRKIYRFIPPVPFHNRVFHSALTLLQKVTPQKIKPEEGIAIEDRPLTHGAVRIYCPQEGASGAGLLWIHGGGYIIGGIATNDRECKAFAKDLGLVVVSVDYRLAPRHPFPAALDDCFEAWNVMQSSADEWGLDRDRIAIAGQSAGGGLAAAVVQRIFDAGGVQPAAQVLMYPMLDDHTAANVELDEAKHALWNNKNNRGGWGWYLAQSPGQATAPAYAVPARREDLSGLPPAWVGVGDVDLFYEEDCAYAERLRTVGVACELHKAPQAPHAFDMIVPEASVSRAFMHSYYQFLRERLRL